MVTITLYVISGVFFAFECGAAMERKGYDPTAWYVLGFIFGVWTRIVIFFIKDNTEEVTKPIVETWICKNCGAENSGHVYICKCGMKKSQNDECSTQ